MLHEPEFESNDDEGAQDVAEAKPSKIRRGLRVVFYGLIAMLIAVAVGIQASPSFAAAVGRNVPKPVAAAMASMTGADMAPVGLTDGKCCSSMSRASLMVGTESGESGCCSQGASTCPLEQAAMAEASGCCSESGAAMASAEGCSGACPASSGEADVLASTASSEAISLPAPGEEAIEDAVSNVDDSASDADVTDEEPATGDSDAT